MSCCGRWRRLPTSPGDSTASAPPTGTPNGPAPCRGCATTWGCARVRFCGVLSARELDRRYAQADLFVLASRFEGYGMVLAEALARGVPILAARSGAVPETVPPEAGVLVQPDDPAALAAALRGLLADAGLRRRLAAGSRAAGLRLPTWPQAAAAFAAACAEVRRG
jgi:glycosyltransferase involved in cell wall biosynthesis